MQKSVRARPAASQGRRKSPKGGALALRLAFIRQLHVYVSLFVAPSLIFFAATGALQTFRIPDQKTAPVAVQKLARLHKDDVFALKPPRPERPKGAPRTETPKPPPSAAVEATKWFFTSVSIAMVVTTLLGIWMALAHGRQKILLWATLAAGTAAPVLLVLAAGSGQQ